MPAHSPAEPLAPASRLFVRLVAAVLLLDLLIVGLAGLSLRDSLELHRQRAQVNTANLTQLLEHDLTASLDKVDLALLATQEEIEHQLAGGGIERKTLEGFLSRQLSRLPDLDALRVTDDQGHIVYGISAPPPPGVHVGDRDYFLGLRDDPRARLFISRPVVSRVSGKWTIVLARRVNRPDGGFAGITYAVLGLAQIQDLFSTIRLGSGGAVSLRGTDLALVVRYPGPIRRDDEPSNRLVSRELRAAVAAIPEAGSYDAAVPLDGVERSNAYRKVAKYPFYIIVGLAATDYLAEWRHGAWMTLGLTAALLLVTFLLAWLARRAWQRREAAVAVLRQQEKKFRTLLESAPDALLLVGSGGDIVMANRQAGDMFGYRRKDLIGRPFALLLPEYDRDGNTAPAGRDWQGVTRNGRRFPIVVSLSPLDTEQGAMAIIAIRDVTEREQAAEALRKSLAEVEDLYQNAPCGYHSIDADGIFRRVNATELNWLGYDRAEVEHKLCLADLLTPASQDTFRASFARFKETGVVRDLPMEMLRKDGTILPVLVSATAIRDAEGRYLLSRSTVYDMTEQQAMERERAEHTQRVEALSRRLVEIQEEERRRLSGELHDRTSPNLAAVKLNLSALASTLPSPMSEDVAALLDDVSALLEDTTASIREISAELRPPVLDHAGLIPALESYADRFARRSGIAVAVRGDVSVPLAPETESLLFRIAQEALTNCAKHARADKIAITLASDGRRIALTIADDGVGFTPDDLGRIDHSPGLGLLTMRERAEFAGGRFRVDSAPGKGTRIEVEI